MPQEIWTAVDEYLTNLIVAPDPTLDAALESAHAAGLPPIAVSPPQGKLLALLVQITGARSILELGTLAGYSALWMAKALPRGGRLVTLEVDPKHADVARKNFEAAGVGGVVDIRVGPALETLPALDGPFDLTFIDADKANIPAYFDWAVRLGHPGSLIVVDNVIRDGKVLDDSGSDPSVAGVRRLNDTLAKDSRVTATTIQTVGSKGYDGFTLARING